MAGHTRKCHISSGSVTIGNYLAACYLIYLDQDESSLKVFITFSRNLVHLLQTLLFYSIHLVMMTVLAIAQHLAV